VALGAAILAATVAERAAADVIRSPHRPPHAPTPARPTTRSPRRRDRPDDHHRGHPRLRRRWLSTSAATENLNLKIKNTNRIARGYRNFGHYRLRLLLNHDRIREDHSPTRIRTVTPRFVA
jgi:hypothetical protein